MVAGSEVKVVFKVMGAEKTAACSWLCTFAQFFCDEGQILAPSRLDSLPDLLFCAGTIVLYKPFIQQELCSVQSCPVLNRALIFAMRVTFGYFEYQRHCHSVIACVPCMPAAAPGAPFNV
jgi:hypothetical protein